VTEDATEGEGEGAEEDEGEGEGAGEDCCSALKERLEEPELISAALLCSALLGITRFVAQAQTITALCPVLPCLVLSCLVLSCLVLSCLVLSCLVLSGSGGGKWQSK
jgi:hypothetical protein